MLIDKSYYDYDYKDPYNEEKERLKALKPKNNDELQEKLSRMGFGNIMAKEDPEETADFIQQSAIGQITTKKNTNKTVL